MIRWAGNNEMPTLAIALIIREGGGADKRDD